MAEYYRNVAKEKPHLKLDVQVLPPKPDDPVFVKSLNDKPGILALAMEHVDDGKGGKTLRGIPFIVPGARFNEVSYSMTLRDIFLIRFAAVQLGLVLYLVGFARRWPSCYGEGHG